MRHGIYTALLMGVLLGAPDAMAQTTSIAMIKAAAETTSDKWMSCALNDLRGGLLRQKSPTGVCYLTAFEGLQRVTRQYLIERKDSSDQACSQRLSVALEDLERQLLDGLNSSGRGRIDGLRNLGERFRGEFRNVITLCEKTEGQTLSQVSTGATGSHR